MGVDIRGYKNKLRKKYRGYRETLSPEEKRQLDDRIFDRLSESSFLARADTVLCFVSTAVEVDTHRLIHYCWRNGKRVAVPRCLNDKGKMDFFLITSWEDMERGRFSLLEPNLSQCEKWVNTDRSVCIVPGFSFDHQGFRLGFGKGYYDRFLSSYQGVKIGICYHKCIAYHLPKGRYDVPVDFLVTEKSIRKIKRTDELEARK
ncbi:5-formyltetrahydrofolate cyclo-ligase [Massiliimalia massiliensis]|uniref:5-formyltetrahydrofolate cyclo-ligase n=1 Tax=Massiliimalia massiliensis TaxID=1852384 RepID=UPI00098741DD|nr:5-formyltetrahydrofolate cyclo-ligase [Massiliimalia massiliensis]